MKIKKLNLKILLIFGLLFFMTGCMFEVESPPPHDTSCCADILKYEELVYPIEKFTLLETPPSPDYGKFINNTIVLDFDASSEEQVYLTVQMPYSRIKNTTIYPHFHWTYREPKAVGDVVWCIEYTCSDVNSYYDYTETTCIADTALDPYQHHRTNFMEINNTFDDSNICIMRLYRDASNQEDDFPVDAAFLEFDIGYYTYDYGEEIE